LMIS
jgi:hypothetical protein